MEEFFHRGCWLSLPPAPPLCDGKLNCFAWRRFFFCFCFFGSSIHISKQKDSLSSKKPTLSLSKSGDGGFPFFFFAFFFAEAAASERVFVSFFFVCLVGSLLLLVLVVVGSFCCCCCCCGGEIYIRTGSASISSITILGIPSCTGNSRPDTGQVNIP